MTTAPNDAFPIETRGLSKTYRLGLWMNKRVEALQSLDLVVPPGQVFGLLGPNGAGKSTTIKILLNLVRQSSGEARIFGVAPNRLDARRQVGFLPENPAPYEYLTGREFVALAGRLGGLSGHALDTRVKQVLAAVEMDRAATLQIRRYSKGMIQRIALAQALINQPKLLILDEPTSGLDPLGRRQMRDLILVERERGTTVLFCTHIIPDVEALCDRMAVLVGGKRVREGSVKELLSSESPVVEVVVENMSLERLRALGCAIQSAQALEGRLVLRVSSEDSQILLTRVLAGGGRVTQVQAARFTLEDLFMNTLKEASYSGIVGGAIS